jgi:hypothetical protein
VYRVPKKNLEKMMNLNREFTDMIEGYDAKHLIFQLNNTGSPIDGIDTYPKLSWPVRMMRF